MDTASAAAALPRGEACAGSWPATPPSASPGCIRHRAPAPFGDLQPHLLPYADLEVQPSDSGSLSGYDVVVLALPHGESADTIGAVQAQFPGLVYRLCVPVDGHHDQARFGWELGPAGEPAPIAGFDVVTADGQGRLTSVLGFLDRVPAAV